jgi:hypothetical protein
MRKRAASKALSASSPNREIAAYRNPAQGNTISRSTSMKGSTTALSFAALSLAMLTPAFAQTPTQSSQDNQSNGVSVTEHLVPAVASLTRTLDTNSAHQGDQFRATLGNNVHLNDGVELRHGDVLVGTVVADDANTPGSSRLAVRFTQAVLKNGQTVPIKATIVGLTTPDGLTSDHYSAPDQVPNGWNDGTFSVDQIGVVKDVDLHSKISSQNSAVFVSTKRSDFKIPARSEFDLAIGAAGTTPQANGAL